MAMILLPLMTNMKRAFHLLPWRAIRAIAFIQKHGADKHGPNTWQAIPKGLHLDACLSHIAHWAAGETIDADTGHSHLWNALTRLSYVVEQEIMEDTMAVEIASLPIETESIQD